ncbi:MAG: TlpA family protein disulfide reductase [Bacteroidetes bacterium]|nr:MAG: TlpA family protein disulfide reductase [Bacteroidota bacterium]
MMVLLSILLSVFNLSAQEQARMLPSVNVKTLTGEIFNTENFSNDGKPIIIDFWATWCKPCIEELTAIHEEYADWQKETGVKLITISIDDARTMNRVAPFVNGKGWNYENYLDANGDFKRAMNVNMPPHTFVLNGKGEIVWQHVGFTEGSQEELIAAVRSLLEKNIAEPVKTN